MVVPAAIAHAAAAKDGPFPCLLAQSATARIQIRKQRGHLVPAQAQVRHADALVLIEESRGDRIALGQHLFGLRQVALEPGAVTPSRDAQQIGPQLVALPYGVAGTAPAREEVFRLGGYGKLRIIRQQQEAILKLSTPVLPVRERLLILPIIGIIDPQRARQLTEQLLQGIRINRAKVVVMDLTGVSGVDATVANHLVQTVEASRLVGAEVIVTGISPEIAQTLVTIGVPLGKMTTVGDLQGGIEEAERLLGYKVVPIDNKSLELEP